MKSEREFWEQLVAAGHISLAAMDRVRRVQSDTEEKTGALIVKLGEISEAALAESYHRYLQLPLLTAEDLRAQRETHPSINPEFLRAERAVLLRAGTPGQLALVLSDPFNTFCTHALAFALESPLQLCVATFSDIEAASRLLQPTSSDSTRARHDDSLSQLRDLAGDAPIVRTVQKIITKALEAKASDIHLEPMDRGLKVRFRIDGVLHEAETLPEEVKEAIAARVKVMASLNIAERRLPQDGRVRLSVNGRETDFRVATSPTICGESVVMRILDSREISLDLAELGFNPTSQAIFREALTRPHGIVLVTGPTGSGKTTTLYAALKELNLPGRKILTIEDPIEYTLPGINQVQVKPQIGLDFASALRAFLRQDPDVMMVGEIRDVETARVAIQASLTGHLILATVHANRAAGVVTRLLDMGIEPYLLTSTLSLVIAQRLVRNICKACAHDGDETSAMEPSSSPAVALGDQLLAPGAGCSRCHFTGFSGRSAILELMPVTAAIRTLILQRADEHQIEQCAVGEGMITMRQDGDSKVEAGMTTTNEVLRVSRGSQA